MVAVSAFGLKKLRPWKCHFFPVFLLINKRKQCMSRRGGLVLVSVKRSAPHGSTSVKRHRTNSHCTNAHLTPIHSTSPSFIFSKHCFSFPSFNG